VNGLAAAKSDLRRRLRAARLALPPHQRDAETAATVRRAHALARGRERAAYVAVRGELDLAALLASRWADGLGVWLPRVAGPGELAWHRVSAAAELRPGAHGIAEPSAELPSAALPAACLMLVPGVGFARDGRRLGQGGGFYDRLLAARHDLDAIGVGFACQVDEALPAEAHDRRLARLLIGGELLEARQTPNPRS
jgi:5-formyltetrahydrofolate cyclo-ligase